MGLQAKQPARAVLEFAQISPGVWLAQRVVPSNAAPGLGHIRRAKPFAFIRPAHNASGLLDTTAGFVVTRNSFATDPVYFDGPAALVNAKRHVEALFALEGE